MRPTPAQQEELTARGGGWIPDSLAGMAFNAAARPRDASDEPLPNLPGFRQSGQAAAAAVCSARGLARLYAMCVSEVDGLPRMLTPETVAEVTQIQAVGEDLVLRCLTRYGIVFQKTDDRLPFGSHQAFGHDGAGGSVGVADPWYDLAYSWIPRRMSFPGGETCAASAWPGPCAAACRPSRGPRGVPDDLQRRRRQPPAVGRDRERRL